MSDLITDAKDSRFRCSEWGEGFEREVVFMDSLRAALSRAEAAEAQLCRAKKAFFPSLAMLMVATVTLPDDKTRVNALKDALTRLAPCPHEAEVERLQRWLMNSDREWNDKLIASDNATKENWRLYREVADANATMSEEITRLKIKCGESSFSFMGIPVFLDPDVPEGIIQIRAAAPKVTP